jgi:hypothetical protein
VLLILTACKAELTPPVSPISPLAPAAVPALTARPQVITDGAVIIYTREGGIAGTSDEWRIYDNGRVVINSKAKGPTQAELSEGTIGNVLRRIADSNFFDLKDSYMPLNTCCDRFTYTLTIVHDGRIKTVRTIDGAEQPPALAEALAQVQELIQKAAPR